MALALKPKAAAITPEELERRRKMVRGAIRTNTIEGAKHGLEVEPIFEAFIAGEIEAADIVPRIKALRNIR